MSAADLVEEQRWPVFANAAVQAGIRSVLCAGLHLEVETGPAVPLPLASLNLYAAKPEAFTATDLEMALLLSSHAAAALATVVRLDEAQARAEGLEEALASRDVIGQAKGILMERQKITEAAAFRLLRDTSTRLNIKLRELAERIAATGEAPDQQGTAQHRGGLQSRLRQIDAVSDTAALAQLDVDDLLDELLGRVSDVLEVDTATVLLVHSSGTHLLATAARGIEEEVAAGVRVPVAHGFAGRVFAEQRAVILRKVDSSTVVNPLLVEKGIRSLLGVPLIAAGEAIGVLHVGTLRPRRFTPEDSELLQRAADRIAMAIQARRTAQERDAARTLAGSLLPTQLPEAAGLELAARYAPDRVAGVGGDWYDVLPLPDGRLGVAIGDVAGHGLNAAVVMGRLRSALRAYALVNDAPETVLEHLDRKMQYFEPGPLAKVVYGVISADRTHLDLSLAGHLPPALARPNQPTTVLNMDADPPLGVRWDISRRSQRLQLPSGALLCFFTDGLVTCRHEDIEVGLRRLEEVLAVDDADRTCATMMTMLLDADRVPDDAAVLVVRRPAPLP